MYQNFYNFNKEPFHITPDPEFLFLSPSQKEALASIIYGVEERKGFIANIGEVGLGKTTILHSYLERVDRRQLKTIYIFNVNVSFKNLLKTIFQEMGIDPGTDDVSEMVNKFYHVLIEEYKQGRNVVLLIDEAQNMPIETLEKLRLLSNLETSTDKLIQIVLTGQPEFEKLLGLNELRQLKQRIAIRTTIFPFTREESMAYIQHRLAKALNKEAPIFTKGALKLIVKEAKGIPRTLNILCDNVLITGFGYQQKPVSTKIVKEVISDIQGKRKRPLLLRWNYAYSVALLLIAGIFWFPPYKIRDLSRENSADLSQLVQAKLIRSKIPIEELPLQMKSHAAHDEAFAPTALKTENQEGDDSSDSYPHENSLYKDIENRWAVNVFSLLLKDDAISLLHKIKKDRYNAYLTEFKYQNKLWHRVRIGFFSSRNDAQRIGKDLSEKSYLNNYWIVKPSMNEIFNHQVN